MFVSGRGCPGAAAWLLGSALAAALLTNIRTQLVTEELNSSHAIATCLRTGQASLVASSSWQYFTGVNLTRSHAVMCLLNVSIVAEYRQFAADLNPTSLVTPKPRLLFRIDWLHLEEQTPGAHECTNTSFVTLRRMTKRSGPLCTTSADRYAWLEDWLTVVIYLHSERSILRFEASFAALLAINVCEGGRTGTATIDVENVTYAYAPGAWYEELLHQASKCEAGRNYTVLARASDTSRLLRVSVLAAPATGDRGCRRLCVESRCFVTGDANASFELVEHVNIVYVAVGRCQSGEPIGFTLKLESVPSPVLLWSPTKGGLSEAAVVVAIGAAVAIIAALLAVMIVVIRKRIVRTKSASKNLSRHDAPAELALFPPEGCTTMAVTSNGDRLSAVYECVDIKDCSPSPTTALCYVDKNEYCKLSGTAHESVYSQLSAF